MSRTTRRAVKQWRSQLSARSFAGMNFDDFEAIAMLPD